jgi:hypothetical protein
MAVRVYLTRPAVLKAAILLLVMGAAAGCPAASADRGSSSRSEPATGALRAFAPEGQSIVWAVRPKDFHSCHTVGSVLRKLQASDVEQAPLRLAAVGADSAWAESLLRWERVDGTVAVLSEREFRKVLGGGKTPAVFVVEDGTIKTSVYVPREAVEDSVQAELEDALDRRSLVAPNRS